MKKILFVLLIAGNLLSPEAYATNDSDQFYDLAKCAGVISFSAIAQKLHIDHAKDYENKNLLQAKYEFFLKVQIELEKEAKKIKSYKKKKFEEISKEHLMSLHRYIQEQKDMQNARAFLLSEVNRCSLKVGYDLVETMNKLGDITAKQENQNITPAQTEPVTKNSDVPKFKDYPVDNVYTGKHHPLVLNKFGKLFKTRLSEAIKNEKPNFAGHYIVTGWGCGTSCYSSAVIDVATGIAYPFPVTAISSVYPLKPEFANEEMGKKQFTI